MIIKSQAQFCFPVTQLQNKSIFSRNKCPIFIACLGKHGTPRTAARRIRGEGCLSLFVSRDLPLGNCGQLWARGRSPVQVGRDQNRPQPTGLYLGTRQEPALAEAPGQWLPWQKYQPPHPPHHRQCPGLCKASTNFSTRFARVQTVRFDFTGVLFHVVMDFPHYISLCWAGALGGSPSEPDKPFYTHAGSNSLFTYTHKTLLTVRRAEQVEMAAEFECRNW